MTATVPNCARCRVAMEAGFLRDRGHGNAMHTPQWVEGEPPERRKWLGYELGLSTKGREVLQVSTWRCPRCGLLESYASESLRPERA